MEQSHPCKSIYQAAARAHNSDVINIDGSGTSLDPYPCEPEPGLHIAGVLIRSYGTQAFVACKNSSLRFSCNTRNNSSSGVSLARITFVNTSLYLVDCSVKMTGVSFVNGSTDALSLNFSRGSTEKIDFSGCTFYNNSGSTLKIRGDSVNLNVRNSSFIDNKLRMRNTESALLIISPQSLQAQLRLNFTNITVSRNTCPGKACLKIGGGNDGLLSMKIKEGKFKNNYASESVVDVSGTSVMEFTATQFRKNTGRAVNIRDGKSVTLKIVNGNFVNNQIEDFNKMANGGAVCVSGFTQKALVFMSRSNFTSNEGDNGGACAFINLTSVTLDIESCRFVQNKGWSSGGALAVGTNYPNWQENATISIGNSNFSGNTLYFGSPNKRSSSNDTRDEGGGGALAFYVYNMLNLTLTNNTFIDNRAEQKNAGAIRANIGTLYQEAQLLNCNFVRNSGAINSGTFQLSVSDPLSSSPPPVQVKYCTFIQNVANGLGTYDIFLYQNILTISFCNIQNNLGGGIFLGGTADTCDVRVENSLISDNDNFMFYLLRNQIDSDASFKFTNVSMLRNNCSGKSSTFHVSMYHTRNLLLFQESKFEDNFCKSGVVKISVTPYPVLGLGEGSLGTTVVLNHTEFRGNSGVAESALTVLDAEVIQIENSSFINNFGSTDGSHVRVQLRSSELQIYKTIFYQSEKSQVFNLHKEQPYNGFLTVTSFGNMSLRESSFISDPVSYDGKALVFVKGAGRVTMDDSVTIQSPFGSKLNLHNFTHWESFNVGKVFTHALITSFSMSTQPCPIGTYSIRRGTSKGFTMEHLVKCLTCPNGGNCTSALAARPNYWGYPIGDEVHFKFCPHGYCCPVVNQNCPYHNASYKLSGCQGNRTGILCGGCKKNFTEALFNTDCVLVVECTHRWYLIVIFICISLFALYLIRKPPIFQKIASNFTRFIASNRKQITTNSRN